jgi:hypothetical protein
MRFLWGEGLKIFKFKCIGNNDAEKLIHKVQGVRHV